MPSTRSRSDRRPFPERSAAQAGGALAVLLVLGAVPSPLPAAAPPSPVDALRRGREIVRLAAESVGGAATLAETKSLVFRAEGPTFNPLQGLTAAAIDTPDQDGSIRFDQWFDYAGARFRQDTRQDLHGGFVLRFGTIAAGANLDNLSFAEKLARRQPAPAQNPAAGVVDVASRWLPPLLLRRAVENLASVRATGQRSVDGRAAVTVEFSWDATTRIEIAVDAATGWPVESRSVAFDALNGDDEQVTRYEGRRSVAGWNLPERVRIVRRGVEVMTLALSEIERNGAIADSTFAPPDGFAVTALSPAPQVVEIAPGLHEIRGLAGGLYRSQVIVRDRDVVLFEPLGPGPSRAVVAETKKLAGSRPISHVVVSHFHADHAAGVGTLARAGATVVAPADQLGVLARYANASFSGVGLSSPPPIQPKSIAVAGEWRLDDPARPLLVYDTGANPHVHGMLVLYDPATRTAITGDLYSVYSEFNETFLAFVDWVEARKLAVDTVLGTHHDPVAFATLREEAAAYRRAHRAP